MQEAADKDVLEALKKSAVSGAVEVHLFPGETAKLTFDRGSLHGEELELAIATAAQTYLALQKKRGVLLNAIANEFLEEYNEICHRDEPESKEQFLSKIHVDSISIGVESSEVFTYIDYVTEDLENFFGDHAISMRLNSDLEVEDIDMVG